MDKGQEYYQRTLNMGDFVASDLDLVQKLDAAFRVSCDSRYNSQILDRADQPILPNGVIKLGQGKSHIVLGFGSVRNPSLEKKLYLGLKVAPEFPYPELSPGKFLGIGSLVKEFENAYVRGDHTPYFICVATWYNEDTNEKYSGLLMEDVSHGKKAMLNEIPNASGEGACYFERIYGDTKDRIFLDPTENPDHLECSVSTKYFKDCARLDVSDILNLTDNSSRVKIVERKLVQI